MGQESGVGRWVCVGSVAKTKTEKPTEPEASAKPHR